MKSLFRVGPKTNDWRPLRKGKETLRHAQRQRRKKAMRRWRLNSESVSQGTSGLIKLHQKLGRSQAGFVPRFLRERARTRNWFWISRLQNCKRISFYCLKLPDSGTLWLYPQETNKAQPDNNNQTNNNQKCQYNHGNAMAHSQYEFSRSGNEGSGGAWKNSEILTHTHYLFNIFLVFFCGEDFLLFYLSLKVKISQLCPTLCDPMDYTVHGILQARILEWVAFPFSRGSSQPRNRTRVSCIAGRSKITWN